MGNRRTNQGGVFLQGRGLEISVVAVFLILLTSMAWFNINEFEQGAKKRSGEMLRTVLQSSYNSINLWTGAQLSNAEGIAAETIVRESARTLLALPRDKDILLASPAMERLRKILSPELTAMGYQGFFIIAPEYISVASMRDTNVGTTNLIAKHRLDILKTVFNGESRVIPAITSDVPISKEFGRSAQREPTMFVAVPLKDDDNSVIGVLTLRLDPVKSFSNILKSARLGSSGETYAFDRDGWLITESRFDEQLRLSGSLLSSEGSLLNIRITDPGGNMLEGYAPTTTRYDQPLTLMAASATKGLYGINTEGYRDYRGVKVFGAWGWDESLGFGMTTEIDEAEVMRPFYASRNIQLLSYGLTALLAVLMTAYLTRVRNVVNRRLEDAQSTLEMRIEERTRELVSINERMHGEIVERVRTEEKLLQTQTELEQVNEKLEQLASLDGLTGIPNRRIFNEFLEREWKRCTREQSPISLLMMDIDYFKLYNDTYGHQAGDTCLKAVGSILTKTGVARRPGDLVARYGGEEFAIILSNTSGEHAAAVAQRVSKAIEQLAIPHSATEVDGRDTVTISMGIATMVPEPGEEAPVLIERSDVALYDAKKCGRNRFSIYKDGDTDMEKC